MKIKIGLFLLITTSFFAQQAMAVSAADEVSSSNPESAENDVLDATKAETVFPKWPERKFYTRAAQIPPPPPGPYMSTALSGAAAGFPGAEYASAKAGVCACSAGC